MFLKQLNQRVDSTELGNSLFCKKRGVKEKFLFLRNMGNGSERTMEKGGAALAADQIHSVLKT